MSASHEVFTYLASTELSIATRSSLFYYSYSTYTAVQTKSYIIWGQITSLATLPASCTATPTVVVSEITDRLIITYGNLFNGYYPIYPDASDNSGCVPSHRPLPIDFPNYAALYSPALCPINYWQACQPDLNQWFSKEQTTPTAFLCCPTSYYCATSFGDSSTGCVSQVSTPLSNVHVLQISQQSGPVSNSITTVYPNTAEAENTVRNPGILVAWQSTDTSFLSYKTSVEEAMRRATTSSTNNSTTAIPNTINADSNRPSLSTNALIAIIVSVITFAVLIVGGVYFLLRLRRRRLQRRAAESAESGGLLKSSQDPDQKLGEGEMQISEMDGGNRPFLELDNSGQRQLTAELGPAYGGAELAPYEDNDNTSRERASAINVSPIELDSGEVSPVGVAADLHRNISAVSALALPNNEQEASLTPVARSHTQYNVLTRPLLSLPADLDKPLPPLHSDPDTHVHHQGSRPALLPRADGYRAVPTESSEQAQSLRRGNRSKFPSSNEL